MHKIHETTTWNSIMHVMIKANEIWLLCIILCFVLGQTIQQIECIHWLFNMSCGRKWKHTHTPHRTQAHEHETRFGLFEWKQLFSNLIQIKRWNGVFNMEILVFLVRVGITVWILLQNCWYRFQSMVSIVWMYRISEIDSEHEENLEFLILK